MNRRHDGGAWLIVVTTTACVLCSFYRVMSRPSSEGLRSVLEKAAWARLQMLAQGDSSALIRPGILDSDKEGELGVHAIRSKKQMHKALHLEAVLGGLVKQTEMKMEKDLQKRNALAIAMHT
jgi:hypothetical protein